MYTVSGHTAFFESLLEIDRSLARMTKSSGCPACGGVLDVRNFPRKPRGVLQLEDIHELRFSFCCRQDGCRASVTSPSVRFLGRKVYSALIVILNAMTAEWRASEFEVCRQTMRRWQHYWLGVCDSGSDFYKEKLTSFAAGFKFRPAEIFAEFRARHFDMRSSWQWCLRFFSSLSVPRKLPS